MNLSVAHAFLIAGALAGLANADAPEFADVKIHPEYEAALLANEFLMHGSVDVVRSAADGEVLVGVGVVATPSGDPPSPKALLDARKVAFAKAEREVSRFLKSEVSTETTIRKETSSEVTNDDDGDATRTRRVRKVADRWIKESSSMTARPKEIGSWRSADGKFLFVAVRVMPVE
jgi:hypothetical protein